MQESFRREEAETLTGADIEDEADVEADEEAEVEAELGEGLSVELLGEDDDELEDSGEEGCDAELLGEFGEDSLNNHRIQVSKHPI